jgi:predicted aspartyl protease
MEVKYKNGLIYTSLEITFEGKTKTIDDIIIDTGAAHSIISPEMVADLGINALLEDELITMYGIGGEQYAYRKKVDNIKFGNLNIQGYKLDFGYIDEKGKINGLFGIDLLMKLGLIIDLQKLSIYKGE